MIQNGKFPGQSNSTFSDLRHQSGPSIWGLLKQSNSSIQLHFLNEDCSEQGNDTAEIYFTDKD